MSGRMGALDHAAVETLLASAGETGLPRLFVYTSGVWVYGTSGPLAVDESSPLRPLALSEPRIAVERSVLAANRGSIRTLVLRPGCVYGGAGGLTAPWFEGEGPLRVVGTGSERWAMVQLDDLADGYRRAIESPLAGEALNLVDESRTTVLDCARAAVRASGARREVVLLPVDEARKSLGPFADALALDQHVDARKARDRLGWRPLHPGFVDAAPRYFRAFRAGREAK